MIEKLFQEHPFFGFVCSVGAAIAGRLASPESAPHIPPIVMECGQLLAWISSAIIMCITVHGWYKRHVKKEG